MTCLYNGYPTHEADRQCPSLETLVRTLPLQEGRALDDWVLAIEAPTSLIAGDERLLDATDVSPSRSVHGKVVETADILYTYPDQSFAIEPSELEPPIYGTETDVSIRYALSCCDEAARRRLPRIQTHSRFVAAARHTHGRLDTLPSSIDISYLLAEDVYPAAHAFTYVVTHYKTIFVFRTAATPQLRLEDASRLMRGPQDLPLKTIAQLYSLRVFERSRDDTIAYEANRL